MESIPVSVPKASPDALPELAEFLSPYLSLFRRRESRESLERYVTGLLTDLPRKNCDTIAQAVAGTSTERLQHLLCDADWDAAKLEEARIRHLASTSPKGGILALDDTGFIKQGKVSVGVARQYSGTLGKIGNCQVVVSAEYVADEPKSSSPLHWPSGARLYLPKGWTDDGARRQRAHIPAELEFKTKLEIALGLLDQAKLWGVPFEVVVADAGYGDNPNFLDGLEERNVRYVCGVERSFGVRLPEEVAAAAKASEKGAEPAPRQGKGRPKLPRSAALYTVEAVVAAQPEERWQTISWREGTKDTLKKQFLAVRVHRATGNPDVGPFGRSASHGRMSTGAEGWLLAERPMPGETGDRKWYYSNLAKDTPLTRLVELAHARWVIEQFYEDAKGECGLDDYQGRRFDGFHRHLALVMLTYSFLATKRVDATTATTATTDGGFSPLGDLQPARGAPTHPRLAAPGPGALVHRDRPDQALPQTQKLTK